MRKINIDTDNRMAMTGAIRKVLAENPSEFDPRKYLVPAREAMTKLCKERFEQFGTAGNADKIKPLPLGEMAKRYRAGKPRPEVRLGAAVPPLLAIEVCVENTDGLIAAQNAGADRVELCASLLEGGLTPSAGMVREALRVADGALPGDGATARRRFPL